ncbi:hypothetical protein C6503_19440 [Candidatus Poribacteria bacterium]|nr:MAG: hypothetical protein C6503_19440 [Candidatus Poribacteria bacterium]
MDKKRHRIKKRRPRRGLNHKNHSRRRSVNPSDMLKKKRAKIRRAAQVREANERQTYHNLRLTTDNR